MPRLRRFLANELEPGEELVLVEHISRCPGCQEQLFKLTGLMRLSVQPADGSASEPMPDDLARQLYALSPSARERTPAHLVGAPVTQDERPLPAAFGRYRLLESVGTGSFGTVYRAWDPQAEREVAVKIMHSSMAHERYSRWRFVREAQTASMLDHPNLARTYEAGSQDGRCYLVSQFIDGPTLSRWLNDRGGPISLDEAARLGVQVAQGLASLHAQGLLHRDLKPSNILLDMTCPSDGLPFRACITDFGLASATSDESGRIRGAAILGTPEYLAPEAARGRPELGGQSIDVYSLGVILYELCVGQCPIQGSSTEETLRLIARGNSPSLRKARPDVPPALAAICDRARQFNPVRRYPTANEMLADLERFLAGNDLVACPGENLLMRLVSILLHRSC